jgi:hypothetical protein
VYCVILRKREKGEEEAFVDEQVVARRGNNQGKRNCLSVYYDEHSLL